MYRLSQRVLPGRIGSLTHLGPTSPLLAEVAVEQDISAIAHSVAYSSDGRFIVSGLLHGNAVQIWDVHTRESIDKPLQSHTGIVRSVACSPDGRFFASTGDDDKVCIYNAPAGTVPDSSLRQRWWKSCNAMSLEDGWIRDEDGTLLLWVPPAHRGAFQSGARLIIDRGVSKWPPKVNIDEIYTYFGRKWVDIGRTFAL